MYFAVSCMVSMDDVPRLCLALSASLARYYRCTARAATSCLHQLANHHSVPFLVLARHPHDPSQLHRFPPAQAPERTTLQESKRETSKILHIILLNTVLSPPRDQNPGRRQLEATLLFLMTLSPRIHGNSGRVRTPYNINNPNLAGLNLRRPSLVF